MERSLNDVVELADHRVAVMEPEDRFHPIQNFEFWPSSNGDPMAITPLDGIQGVPMYEMTDHAYMQIAERLGFGRHAKYVRSLPDSLQKAAVDFEIHIRKQYKKAMMFRSVNGATLPRMVRAVLSERFEPFDDHVLLRSIHGAFTEMGIYPGAIEAKGMSFEETHTHIRLLWGEQQANERGDVVRRGIHIRNSEVGLSSVDIRPVVYVLACSNGMVSARHIGGIRHVGNPTRLRGKVKDAINMAINDGDRLSEQFADSLRVRFENPINVLAGIQKNDTLTQDQLQRAILHFNESGQGRTKYDVVQAITRAAQDEATHEDRFQVELVGARALDANLERFDRQEVA